ncbi:P-aminobenzoate N-oxygenase AurF [Micromonospora pallida]|uniref:p-aminobenzoate N-oxygenase AurF n=1 Tax=Micromonospora pallida TaxID=145854 RepID=A0A1C6RUD3_9ACTN|nr:ferritin-like domain-containing protein [Micromonospora pallida]SCL20734.1 P-aminobenzoate N-oxygenase AurF [Micromonospora pallida]
MEDRSGSLVFESTTTTRFTWDYEAKADKLRALYEKGKAAQWNALTDIDWSAELRYGAPLPETAASAAQLRSPDCPVPPELWNDYRWEYHCWMTSQFLHGEQGALLATSRLVQIVPNIDDKLYAASQVADEARHVEAFSMYLQRLGRSYPINPALRSLLFQVVADNRWDIVYLGMQVIVEGLALAVFRFGQASAFDPVIQQITELVARDEARHVAFGVLALQGSYDELTSAERAERTDFLKEASLLMSRRFQLEEIWERMDLDVAAGIRYARSDPTMVDFRRALFAKIVSIIQKLGLLTPDVRTHLEELSLLRPSAGVRR